MGASAQFTASVLGMPNTGVTWQVNGAAGGSTQAGTISSTGLFVPPAVLPQAASVSIGAVSTSDPTVSSFLLVTLEAMAATTVTVSGPSTINLGVPAQFAATIAGSANGNVTWAVDGSIGGSSTYGTISSSGLYTPPASVPAVNGIVITATSSGSPAISGTFGSTILNPIPVVNAASASTTDGRNYLIDVRGSNFVTGADLLVSGQHMSTVALTQTDLEATVTYPSVQALSVAVMVENPAPGATQSLPVTVAENAPTATSVTVTGAIALTAGGTAQYAAFVAGLTDQTVTWAVNGAAGGSSTYGTISTFGLYTAPASVPAKNVIAITAVSSVSPSSSGALNTTVLNPVPVIASATASTTDGKSYLVDVHGSNFMTTSTVLVGGQSVNTLVLSATELQSTISFASAQSLAVIVNVLNPNPGATESAAVGVTANAPSATSVAVTGPATIGVGGAAQYAAVVSGLTNQTVTWAVNGSTGGSAEYGTISASGLYTAPASVPAANSILITAASSASPVISGTAVASILDPVPVISAATASTTDGKTYLIDVQGSNFLTGATLLVNAQAANTVSVTKTDLQTTIAYASVQELSVAVMVQNPSPGATQSLPVNVVKSAPLATSVTVTGSASIHAGSASQYAATVAGVTDQTVTWAINGSAGGSATYGTISASGLYTPPATVPSSNVVVLSAISNASPAVSGSFSVTLLNAIPVVASATGVTTDGKSYLIDVRGLNFATGATLLIGSQPAQTTTVSQNELQATISFTTAQALAVTVSVLNPNPGATESSAVHVSASAPTPVTVTVSGPATVNLGAPTLYAAVVTGVQSQAVTWMVDGVAGGNATWGTIASDGTYTPPATVPTPNALVVTATSTSAPTASGQMNVTLLEPVPVIGSASASTMDGGFTYLLNVPGSNFMAGAMVLINGQPVATTAVSQNDLQVTVVYSSVQALQVAVIVQNPSPGSTQSAAVNISAVPPTATATAAARFLDQASFGPTAASIAHVQQIGLQAALAEQFKQSTTLFSEPPPAPLPQCNFSNYICTQSEFLNVTVWGSDQLRQRVAMALSEIWVAPILEDNEMPFYLNVLANDAFSNYRTIMQDVTLTPNMGRYLNMVNSGKPPAGQIANENFGREMMQLFTLGLDVLNPDGTLQTDIQNNPIPAYSELQVEAFARAYTGWTFANADGSTPSALNYTPNGQHFMVPVESQHDTSQKILLNGTTLPAGQTAEQDLTGALDNIFAHPNVGPFICRQLIQHLVTSAPSPAYVQRVAAAFADNGSGVRGDMKAVLTAILLDSEARAGDAQAGDQAELTPAVNGGHLREPLLWTLNLLRGLNAVQPDASNRWPFVSFMGNIVGWTGEMPFSQASVFNYFSPQYVIPQSSLNAPEFQMESTSSVVPRLDLANVMIHNAAYAPVVDLSATSVFGQKASDPAALADYLSMIFMHSQMPTDMRSSLIAEIASIPAFDPQSRVEVAVYLVVTSSQYKIIN